MGYNPDTVERWRRVDFHQKPPSGAKSLAQQFKRLPGKHKDLSLSPSTKNIKAP